MSNQPGLALPEGVASEFQKDRADREAAHNMLRGLSSQIFIAYAATQVPKTMAQDKADAIAACDKLAIEYLIATGVVRQLKDPS